MNPFMMMFGPMGFGFMGGGCGCGVNMPYYGQNDMCTFMNFPVFRNTSMDYMLDPRLAMMQSQQSWMNGSGNMFGNSYLPLFSNFPGVNNNWTFPWMQPKAETDDDRKKREAREAEDKKPENVEKKAKIDSYKTYLERFKANLDEDGKKDFKVVEDKLAEILKEEKVDDRLKKVEELFRETFTPEALTKIALSDTEIDSKLYKIGYNFPSGISKHEPNEQEKIINKYVLELNLSDPLSVGKFASAVHGGEEYILQVISSWNDKHNDDEKGILRGLAKHIPDGDQKDKQVHYDECIEKFTNALKAKADKFMEDNGGAVKFPNLSAQYKLVEEKFSEYDKTASASDKQSKINELADECDKLYAMLRVQEAVLLNKKVVNKYAEKMNAIHSNAIPKDIIVKETLQDLEKENIEVPNSEDLDEIPEQDRGFRVRVNSGNSDAEDKMREFDKAADGDAKKLAQFLVDDHKIKAVKGFEDKGIYETREEWTNVPKKYYGITEDNRLVEIKYNEETQEFEALSDKAVTADEIGAYVKTASDIEIYVKAAKITPSKYTKGAYVSVAKHPKTTDHREYSDAFVIRNNKFVKIKGVLLRNGTVVLEDGTKKSISDLTDDDVTEVKSEDDIYTETATSVVPTKPKTDKKDTKPVEASKVTKTNINKKSEAYEQGDFVANKLDGSTKKRDHIRINNILTAINKDNVLDFLAGYYSHNFHEGIIEYLDDEWDGGRITIDSKKNLINAFIKYAESKGISSSDERIEEIKSILSDYEKEGEFGDCKTFNHNDAWWGWIDTTNDLLDGVTAFFGDSKTHNEIIDENMKSLFEELKAKE